MQERFEIDEDTRRQVEMSEMPELEKQRTADAYEEYEATIDWSKAKLVSFPNLKPTTEDSSHVGILKFDLNDYSAKIDFIRAQNVNQVYSVLLDIMNILRKYRKHYDFNRRIAKRALFDQLDDEICQVVNDSNIDLYE